MKRFGVLLLVFCVSASLWAAEADPKQVTSERLADQLQAAIAKAIKESKDAKDAKEGGTENAGRRESVYYLAQAAALVKRAKNRRDAENLQQMLAQMQNQVINEEINGLCTALIAQLETESLAREQATVDTVDASVEKAVALAFSASDPKELDAPIIELSKYSLRQDYDSTAVSQRAAEKARSAVNFLCRWQDYLSQMKSGNGDEASAVLTSLARETGSFPFVPRSQILDRIKPGSTQADGSTAGPAAPVLPSMKGKTLADIEDLKQTLRELQAKNRNTQGVQDMLQQVVALDRAYEEYSIGLVGQAFSYCTNSNNNYGNASADFIPLRQELLIQVLPPYLGVDKTYPAVAKEAPTDYLQRVIKESREKGDWITLWKALEAYRSVAFSGQPPNWLSSDITGVSQLIIAQNQEKAGQYVDAIRAYRRVLSQAGQNLPLDAAAERLKVLQKEHPAEYETATKQVEQPPRMIQMNGASSPVVPTR